VVDIGAIFHFLNCLQLKFLIIIWLQLSQLPTQILFCTLGVIRYQSISKTATYSCNVTNTCIYIYIYRERGRGGERERDEVPCKFCLVIFDQKQKVRDFDASPYYYCLMKKIDLIINFTSHFRG